MRLFEVVGLKRQTVKPRLIVGIRYQLKFVVELSLVVKAIPGTNLSELMAEEWQKINAKGLETQGQALGRALFDSAVEGFLVPSARVAGAMNLVVFPGNLQKTSQQVVLEETELKAWLKES